MKPRSSKQCMTYGIVLFFKIVVTKAYPLIIEAEEIWTA